MSKFIDQIHHVASSMNFPIGFRKPSDSTKVPSILLILEVSNLKTKINKDAIAEADAALLNVSDANADTINLFVNDSGSVPLGIYWSNENKNKIDDIIKNKIDFVIFDLSSKPINKVPFLHNNPNIFLKI